MNPRYVKWKSILAWISVIFGAIMLPPVLSASSFGDGMGNILFAIALGLPGTWWIYCNTKDKKAAGAYASTVQNHTQLSEMLQTTDPTIVAGMGTPEPPTPQKRRWPLIAGTSVAAMMIAGVVTPTPEPAVESVVSTSTEPSTPEATTSQAAPTTSSASRQPATTSSTTKPPTTTRSPEPTTTQPAPAVDEPATVPQGFAEIPQEAATVAEEPPAPAPAPVPAPIPAAVAPAAPSTNYKNCTAVWNAIGGPIYAGNPGYASHLDRDGDGVGCETDPR